MTGLSSSHCSLDRLIITHFAKKDHIRALPECGTQRSKIAFSICTDLTLAYNAAVVAVQVLKRVFQSDDMSLACMVDPVDQAGHSGGFSAACGACDKNHSTGIVSNVHNVIRDHKLCRIRQPESDHTDHGSKGTTLFVSIDAEAGNTGNGKRKVIVAGFQKF